MLFLGQAWPGCWPCFQRAFRTGAAKKARQVCVMVKQIGFQLQVLVRIYRVLGGVSDCRHGLHLRRWYGRIPTTVQFSMLWHSLVQHNTVFRTMSACRDTIVALRHSSKRNAQREGKAGCIKCCRGTGPTAKASHCLVPPRVLLSRYSSLTKGFHSSNLLTCWSFTPRILNCTLHTVSALFEQGLHSP